MQALAQSFLSGQPKSCHHRPTSGFTLAELLIALAILGVIATFTISKVLTGSQNSQFNAVAKEDIAMVTGALQTAQLNGTTKISDLTPYMNYTKVETTQTIDDITGGWSFVCNGTANIFCIRLHNGSVMRYRDNASFGGSTAANGIWFQIDPDGKVTDGTTNGPGKMLVMFLYYNGRVIDGANIPTTTNSLATYTANSNNTPTWFQW